MNIVGKYETVIYYTAEYNSTLCLQYAFDVLMRICTCSGILDEYCKFTRLSLSLSASFHNAVCTSTLGFCVPCRDPVL